MLKFRERMEIMQKRKFREKYRIFKNKCKILAKKIAKIHQNRLNFENLSPSPIDGLTQTMNIDLRTTRRHQTIHRFP